MSSSGIDTDDSKTNESKSSPEPTTNSGAGGADDTSSRATDRAEVLKDIGGGGDDNNGKKDLTDVNDANIPEEEEVKTGLNSSIMKQDDKKGGLNTSTLGNIGPTGVKKKDESMVPTHRPIFAAKSQQELADERFKMSAQEYLDTYKIGVYLQDAVKIILDRREEKPLELLLEYLNTAMKGEHILLREYAFINATPLNRKCFLQ